MSWALGLAITLGIIGGLCASMQGPVTNSISQRSGVLQAAFLVHVAGALLAGAAMLIFRQSNLPALGPIALKAFLAGALGVMILSSVTYAVGQVGTTAAVSLLIGAQLMGAMVIDRFGLFDQAVRTVSLPRLAGILLLMIGTYLVLRH